NTVIKKNYLKEGSQSNSRICYGKRTIADSKRERPFFQMSYSIKPIQLSVIEGLIPPIHQKSFYQFDNNSSPYIYDIAATSTYCFISDSNHQITSFEYKNSGFTFAGKLNYHTDTITKLKLHKNQFIISSSKDGRIALWDLRIPSRQPTNVFQAKNHEPLLSFDINNSDTILAA
ncbi:21039_t:CDS:2, partial [Gigaspora rosea]